MKNSFYVPADSNVEDFFNIVNKLRDDLEELLRGSISKTQIIEYVKKLVNDGTVFEWNKESMFWILANPREMPSDARIDILYTHTYIAVSIMANAYMTMPEEMIKIDGFMNAFKLGLNGTTGRAFKGYEFESLNGLVDCMYLF